MTSSYAWLVWALLSLLTYSFWGVFNALAARHISANSVLFCSAVGYFFVGLVALAFIGFKPSLSVHSLANRGVIYGLLVGLATGLGGLFLLVSLHRGGSASIVVPLTSIYPLATVLFNLVFLHDSITLRQGIGILLSVIGVTLLSM